MENNSLVMFEQVLRPVAVNGSRESSRTNHDDGGWLILKEAQGYEVRGDRGEGLWYCYADTILMGIALLKRGE